jgi:DNA-binding MarR family transcriptional regulator
MLLLRATLALGRRLRAERPAASITVAGVSILGTLRRLGVIPAVRLAAEERLQPQSLTRLLASLEAEGLILRLRGTVDRREMQVGITEAGIALLRSELSLRSAWLEQAMSTVLTDAERTQLVAAADLMIRLSDHGPA